MEVAGIRQPVVAPERHFRFELPSDIGASGVVVSVGAIFNPEFTPGGTFPITISNLVALLEDELNLYVAGAPVVFQNGASVDPASGRLLVEPDQDLTVTVPVGVAGISASESRSAEVLLQYGAHSQSTLVSLSDISAAGGVLGVPFTIKFDPSEAGSQVIVATIDPLNALTETSDLDNSKGTSVIVRSKYILSAEPMDNFVVLPSVVACSNEPVSPYSVTKINKKTLQVRCRERTTGKEVRGCSYRASLYQTDQNYRGGHEHTVDRPLGKLIPAAAETELQQIPNGGAVLEYEAPEVSGEVTIGVSGEGPDRSIIPVNEVKLAVKFADLAALTPPMIDSKTWLILDVESHPSAIHGTAELDEAIPILVQEYRAALEFLGVDLRIANPLESEAASLPWGGLLDIHKDWKRPHCTHRDGRAMDISVNYIEALRSNITDDEEDAIAAALEATKTKFYSDTEGNHWHVRVK